MRDTLKSLRYFVFLLAIMMSGNALASNAASSFEGLRFTYLKDFVNVKEVGAKFEFDKVSKPIRLNITLDQLTIIKNVPSLQKLGILNPNLSLIEINTMPLSLCSAVSLDFTSVVLKAIYESMGVAYRSGSGLLQVYVYLNVQNDYGNTEKKLLYSFRFNKAIANKINWDNFDPENLVKVAIGYHASNFLNTTLEREYNNYRQLNAGN